MATERVPDGEDVVAFLERLAGSTPWVTGVGAVTDVALVVADEAGETPRPLPGRSQLLSLAGPPAGPLMAIVSAAGTEHGGQLAGARSAGVWLLLQDATSIRNATAAVPAARAKPPSDDDEADESPRYGDRIDHFVFGLCDVMVVREERMKIRDVSGGGKLREIHLGAFKVLKPTIQDGRRVFKLVKK